MNKRYNPHKRYKGIYIPEGIYHLKTLTPVSKLVYGRLLRYCGKNGKAYPKQQTIAEELSISLSSVKRSIQQLAKEGLIEVARGSKRLHQNNSYYFLEHEAIGSFEEDQNETSQESEMTPPDSSKRTLVHIEESHIKESHTKEREEAEDKISYKSYLDKWNILAKEINVSPILKISDNRKKSINARVKEFGKDNILKAFDLIKKSSFLMGENKRNWKITFDWLFNQANMTKVLEDRYADIELITPTIKDEDDGSWMTPKE